MPFTAQELSNITNAVIDYHLRGPVDSQIIQARPFYDALVGAKKTFPGGKEFITKRVKGQYESSAAGYEGDDEVSYSNPAHIKQAQYKWYELHTGIKVTHTELKKEGISVVDSRGAQTATHSEAELVALTSLLDDKMEDLREGRARSLAEMFWRDGSQDSKAIPGVQALIFTSPTTGTTGGLDRVANSWWRNRAQLSIDVSTASNLNLVTALQQQFRQLRRFSTPRHKFFAGSDFMDGFEKELRSKGNFTLEGWAKAGRIDASVADLAFKGVEVMYEPLLDDLSLSKYGYVLDIRPKGICLMAMEGEWEKMHTPERPPEKYVIYRAVTDTGALAAWRLNTSLVISIA